MSEARHIFIADDQRVYISLLGYFFKKDFSFRFINYKNAEDCLANLALNPELILLNHRLPGADTTDVLNEIKEKCPQCYVIVLLDKTDDGLQHQLFEKGADDFIVMEELNPVLLVNKIEAYLTRDYVEPGITSHIRRLVNRNVIYLVLALTAIGAGIYYYM